MPLHADGVPALYAGEFFTAAIQELHRFHGLHPDPEGLGSPLGHPHRQLSNDAAGSLLTLRTAQSLPLTGPSTLGFDSAHFQTKPPPVCYRASWQLPGPDFHRHATTSLRTTINHLHGQPPLCWAHRKASVK
jgi:hypothetical protein